jgi:hypothetical protein
MKVWVLHDDDKDGNIYGIHGVTSDPAVAKLWETEYELLQGGRLRDR